MNNTNVIVTGYVGNDPTLLTAKSGISWTQFRVGSTKRWRDSEGNWVEGPTMWFTVKCWQDKAKNVAESLRKGVPVIVSGRLCEEPYVLTRTGQDGEPVTELRNSLTIENAVVGIDMSRGTVKYTRNDRDVPEPVTVPGWLAEKHVESVANLTPAYSAKSSIEDADDSEPYGDVAELDREEVYAMV